MTFRFIPSKPEERNFLRLLLFLLSLSLLMIYSVSPSVYVGDSGLFSSASYFLGTAHPPGYPLFILLGKLITFLPFGNIALKINLLSALFGALTMVVAYEATFYITKKHVMSLFAPLTIFTSSNFIFESSKAEVYTLNAFFIILIFYFGLRALKEKKCFNAILVSSFLFGLGMGNHQSISFMVFIIVYIIVIKRKELPFGTIATSLVLFIIGFSIYFFLYLRSITDGYIVYSKVYSLTDFFSIIFRMGYSSNTLYAIKGVSQSGTGWIFSIKNIGLILLKEIHPLIWFFVLTGIISFYRNKKIFWYIVISLIIWLPLAKITAPAEKMTYGDFFIVTPFFLPLIPLVGVLAGTGLHILCEKIKAHSLLIARTIVTGLIAFQMLHVSVAFLKSSHSDYFVAYQWIRDIAKVFKPKSVYLAYGDNPSFLGFYGFGVERMRDDVLYLDAKPGDRSVRITLSPEWKFFQWYPEFYKAERVSVEYFYPIAEKGKLYSTLVGSIPQDIAYKFDVKWYTLVSILLSRDNTPSYEKSFKDDFKKLDYQQAIAGRRIDPMELEILQHYAFTIWKYADLLAYENARDTDYFYKLAIYIAHKRKLKYEIMKKYISYMDENKRAQEAQNFISVIKNSASDIKIKKEIEAIEDWHRAQNIDK
jgi:hypothetical protein